MDMAPTDNSPSENLVKISKMIDHLQFLVPFRLMEAHIRTKISSRNRLPSVGRREQRKRDPQMKIRIVLLGCQKERLTSNDLEKNGSQRNRGARKRVTTNKKIRPDGQSSQTHCTPPRTTKNLDD
ncbi:hypothetical protein WA026_009194 [Henosepilachna vigintioctopunctata]|uniref:Uncharacterized protein n=1 Tax=Henosepilachna vigintioctopunctata TaxID=420089 RepID=A0AAW1UWS4_9CUCU